MHNFMQFVGRMNLVVWGVGIYLAHLMLYLLLGTPTWAVTALLATVVWVAVLFIVKLAARTWKDEQESGPRT